MTLRTLRLETSWGELSLAGGSRAGEGTLLLLPQLRLALDAGRPHRALPPMTTVLISHGHVDHLGALSYWASQRSLNRMGSARLLVPRAIADHIAALLEVHGTLEGVGPYPVEIVPLEEGDRLRLRPDMELVAFETDHRVPTVGAELWWRRRRLRPQLSHLAPDEVAARRAAGEAVTEPVTTPLLAYLADSGAGLLARRPDLLAAEVVAMECSFFRPADRRRADDYGHLHIEDLLASAGGLGCRHLVVLHASRRHRLREVEEILARDLEPHLPCRLHHLVVDWE